MNEKYINRAFFLLSISVFLFSLTQKTYCVDGDCGSLGSGLLCFLLGFLGLGFGGASISWLANPLLLISYIITLKKLNLKLLIAIGSTFLGLAFLLFPEVIKNEVGHYGKVTDYELGYWLWIVSSIIYVIGILFLGIGRKKGKNRYLQLTGLVQN